MEVEKMKTLNRVVSSGSYLRSWFAKDHRTRIYTMNLDRHGVKGNVFTLYYSSSTVHGLGVIKDVFTNDNNKNNDNNSKWSLQ